MARERADDRLERAGVFSGRLLGALLGVAVAAYCLEGIFLPGRNTTVFSGDMGVKYMQVRSLAAGHGAVDGLRDPIDTDGRFFPLRPPFAFAAEGKVVTAYLNPLTYLGSLAYRALGVTGARSVPLLGAVVCVVAVLGLAGALGLPPLARRAVALLALVATPLWFYGWVFWEHAPAVACSLTATWLLVQSSFARPRVAAVAAGALLGLGTAFRPEIAAYAVALVVAVGLCLGRRRDAARLAAVLAVAAISFLGVMAALPDMPLAAVIDRTLEGSAGRSPFASSQLASAQVRSQTLGFMYLGTLSTGGSHPADAWLGAAGVSGCLLLVLGLFERWPGAAALQLVASLCAVAAATTAVYALRDDTMLLTGLFTAFPLVLATLPALVQLAASRAGAGSGGEQRAAAVARCLAWVTLAFTAIASLFSPSGGGNQWGPRFLLPVIPLAVLLWGARLWGRDGIPRLAPPRLRNLVVAVTAVAVLTGVLVQVVGVRNHLALRWQRAASMQAIAALPPRYILSTRWFIPQGLVLMADVYDKRLLLTTSPDDVARAVAALSRRGEQSFVLIQSDAEDPIARIEHFVPVRAVGFSFLPTKLVAKEFRRQD